MKVMSSRLLFKEYLVKEIQKYIKKLIDNIEISDFSYEASEYKKLIGKKFQIMFQ